MASLETLLPVVAIAGGVYYLIRMDEQRTQTPVYRDEMIHPVTYRLRPPPDKLNAWLLTPMWGQKRYRPYKAFPAPGNLTDHLFVNPVTGQVLVGQQNAGFEAS